MQAEHAPGASENAATHAAASCCTANGPGLANGTVGQYGIFHILACDASGARLETCDDEFAVTMRLAAGGTKLRIRMLNNGDGSYTCGYKASVSGRYAIDIRLHGEALPGSPFACYVSTLTPVAAMCKLKGAALTHAIAREQQAFEIQFCDLQGQIAHAEDLEVYVEPKGEQQHAGDVLGEHAELFDTASGAKVDRLPLVDKLRSVALFAPLGVAQLQLLVEAMQEVQLSRHEWVFQEGEAGDAFYVIASGTAEVSAMGGARRLTAGWARRE